MKYEGSIRKLRQLTREIEEHDSYSNLLHSVYKLGMFLGDEVPGWNEAKKVVDGSDLLNQALEGGGDE